MDMAYSKSLANLKKLEAIHNTVLRKLDTEIKDWAKRLEACQLERKNQFDNFRLGREIRIAEIQQLKADKRELRGQIKRLKAEFAKSSSICHRKQITKIQELKAEIRELYQKIVELRKKLGVRAELEDTIRQLKEDKEKINSSQAVKILQLETKNQVDKERQIADSQLLEHGKRLGARILELQANKTQLQKDQEQLKLALAECKRLGAWVFGNKQQLRELLIVIPDGEIKVFDPLVGRCIRRNENFNDFLPANKDAVLENWRTGYYWIPSQCCGNDFYGGTVNKANYLAMLMKYSKCMGVHWLGGNNGAYGVAINLRRLVKREPEAQRLIEKLTHFKVINWNILNRLEVELIDKVWKESVRDQFIKAIEKKFEVNLKFEDCGELRDYFDQIVEDTNQKWTFGKNREAKIDIDKIVGCISFLTIIKWVV